MAQSSTTGEPAARSEWGGTLLAPYRLRALRVAVSTRLAVVAIMAVALVSEHHLDLRGVALVVVMAANVAYLIARVPWDELLHRPAGRWWLYAWSALDIAAITVGITITGHNSSELFVLYALAMVLFAASYPASGQAVLFAFTVACYLTVLGLDGWETTAGAVVVRVGGLAMVAYVASFLSRELLGQAAAHAEARVESESRAALLAEVASSARAMSTLDGAQVLDRVVECAMQLGFDGAELCLFDEQSRSWTVAHSSGPSLEPAPVCPIDSGAAGLVHARRETVVLDRHSGWPVEVRTALDAGYRFVVASPVGSSGELVGALVAGKQSRSEPYPHEVECLDLLAAHAGAALDNARLYAERGAFEARLAHQAFHDSLTGLPNRALFLDRLEQALARSRRDSEPLGVLFIDLDRFKAVNDSLGHDVGDQLLAAVSQRLQGCLRPGDTLARYGGDEFTVLLEKLRSDDDGIDVADRLLRALDDPFTLEGRQVAVSASIGASFAKAPLAADVDPLREADFAMYRAKERGSGRWEVFRSEMNVQALHRLELESELRSALDDGELFLAYQPVVELASGRITGVEALARWRHRTRGDLSPVEFVPAAERAGLAGRLGGWVIDEACRQAQDWERLQLPPLTVAVNVAADQLTAVDFPDQVGEILRRSGLEPCRLTLEVGEATVTGAGTTVLGAIREIERLGVRVAIDDFGRGYSSLRELKNLPVHVVKVDQSLVQGVVDDAGDRAVVRSLVNLAGELGMLVGAQGVETEAQMEQVKALGCVVAQGFWFSMPVNAAAIAELLRAPGVAAARS